MKVTFIGMGIMGSRMASNLLKNKVDLTVFNRSSEGTKPIVQQGAYLANSLQEAVKSADVIITMLSTPEAVQSMAFGEEGFVEAAKDGALWMDCSTVNPSFARNCGEYASGLQLRYMDAPVAGTKPQAQNAELVFFCGGKEKDLKEVEPFLEMMGQKFMHLGEAGMGASFKMLVNSLLAQNMLIFSETLLMGQKMGLSREFLLDTLPNLVVSAPFTKSKAEMIRSNDYEVQFPLELMHKDLHLLSMTAYEHGQSMLLANACKDIYNDARSVGLGRSDFSAIHKYLESKSNLE